jgi:hypothetical protein
MHHAFSSNQLIFRTRCNVDSDTLQLFMGILALLTYLYEIPAGACLGYLILQTFCLILQISSRNPPFKRSLLGICTEGEAQCRPSSHP